MFPLFCSLFRGESCSKVGMSDCWFMALSHSCDVIGMPFIWSMWPCVISWGSEKWSCEVYELASFSKLELRNSGLMVVSHMLCLSWCVFDSMALFDTRDEEGKTSQKENTLKELEFLRHCSNIVQNSFWMVTDYPLLQCLDFFVIVAISPLVFI